jgi:hypothetical protein
VDGIHKIDEFATVYFLQECSLLAQLSHRGMTSIDIPHIKVKKNESCQIVDIGSLLLTVKKRIQAEGPNPFV